MASDENSKEIIVLYYDSIDGLRAKGIPMEVISRPNPFPKEPHKFYCPEPH